MSDVLAQDPRAALEAAAASLPPEPAAGDATGCSIAVRFPDGQRRQRRFCLVSNEEAAAGQPFVLTESFPGEPLLHNCAVEVMLVCRQRGDDGLRRSLTDTVQTHSRLADGCGAVVQGLCSQERVDPSFAGTDLQTVRDVRMLQAPQQWTTCQSLWRTQS